MKKSAQGLATVDIKGKNYVMVNSRVKYFRENFKDFTLETQWIRLDEKMAICKAIVKDAKDRVYSTGTAYEMANGTFINKTSYIENCETSAIGRALGFCNIGIDVGIASAEEVGNAIKSQGTVKFPQGTPPRTPIKSEPVKPEFAIKGKQCTRDEYINKLAEVAKKNGISIDILVAETKIDKDFPDMSDKEVLQIGKALAKAIKK